MGDTVRTMSSLIYNMMLKGANNDELERAIKHSMAIIDCNNSENENCIHTLKQRYIEE